MESLTEHTTLPVLPQDVIYFSLGDGMYIRRGDKAMRLKGRGVHETFLKLAPLMTGHHTLEAICNQVSPPGREAVRKLLQSIWQRGILLSRAAADFSLLNGDEHERFASQIAFLEHLMDAPVASFLKFRNARLAVMGHGPAALAAVKSLIRNGARHVQAAVDFDAGEADALRLAAAEFGATIDLRGGTSLAPLKEMAIDVLCYVSDRPDLGLMMDLTEECLEAGVTFLPAAVYAGAGRIGPIHRGGYAGCWNCSFLRFAERANPVEAAGLWRYRATRQALVEASLHASAPAHGIIGNAVAFRLFSHLSGLSSRPTFVDSIDLGTLETRSSRVLAHPLCTACAPLPAAATDADDLAPVVRVRQLIDATFGVFGDFDDARLPQTPVFQSRLPAGVKGQGTGQPWISGYSFNSNADARIQALMAASSAYARALAAHRRPGDVPVSVLGDASAALSAVACGLDIAAAESAAVGDAWMLEALQRMSIGSLRAREVNVLAWAPDLQIYLELLRSTGPQVLVAVTGLGPARVSLTEVRRMPVGERQVFVGVGHDDETALRNGLAEALGVCLGGGSSSRTWGCLLPSTLGYPCPPLSMVLSSEPDIAGPQEEHGYGSTCVTCDITPPDLQAAGVYAALAFFAQPARTFL